MNACLALALAAEGGFNPLDPSGAGGFFWTLVIFAVSLPLMWMLVFSKVATAMLGRDTQASAAIQSAERASAEAEKARVAVEVALGEAQAQAAKLIAGARERAEAREREILEGAKRQGDVLIENARAAIRVEQEKAIASIRGAVVDLSLHAASRVIGRNVGAEDDRRMVHEIVSAAEAGKR